MQIRWNDISKINQYKISVEWDDYDIIFHVFFFLAYFSNSMIFFYDFFFSGCSKNSRFSKFSIYPMNPKIPIVRWNVTRHILHINNHHVQLIITQSKNIKENNTINRILIVYNDFTSSYMEVFTKNYKYETQLFAHLNQLKIDIFKTIIFPSLFRIKISWETGDFFLKM